MKARLYSGDEIIAELEAPEPVPPKVWGHRVREIDGIQYDPDNGTVLLERHQPPPDVFVIAGIDYDGAAVYLIELG